MAKRIKRLMPGRQYRLKRDIYGLRGSHAVGNCVDHLVVDTVFTVGTNEAGDQVLRAYGREFVLTDALEYDARTRSEDITDE